MKKYLISLLFVLILLYIMYVNLFFRISVSEAIEIAESVVEEKYATICGGGFQKKLTLTVDHPNAKYSFYSDNGKCSIFVDINEFGGYDTGIGAN